MRIEKLIENHIKDVMGRKYWESIFPLSEGMDYDQYTKWLRNIYWALPAQSPDISKELTEFKF